MALGDYVANRTGLLLVDPYNDLLSDGGKLWPQAKAVAEAVDLLAHLCALLETARRAGVVVFYVPHRQWREGNYDGWRHPGPWQTSTDREAVFGEGMWGGDWHPELVPQPGDAVIQQHWGQNGFANTDLDFQLKQRGIEKIIVVGMLANTCVEGTARVRTFGGIGAHGVAVAHEQNGDFLRVLPVAFDGHALAAPGG